MQPNDDTQQTQPDRNHRRRGVRASVPFPRRTAVPSRHGLRGPISHDDLKSALSELGYELHQKRKQKSAVTQKEEVEGEKRVTIYVPTAMRTAIGHASVATEKNISTIVSEALELWMAKHGLRY